MLDFGLFTVKSMKFSLARLSKIQVYICLSKRAETANFSHVMV